MNDYAWWKVRAWYGMTLRAWLGMLRAYRFKFSLSRVHRLILVSLIAPINSVLAAAQSVFYGSALKRQEVPPCIFVIGHWRTGTTFLHELLANDPRLVAPTAMQVLCPAHFMISRWFSWFYEFLAPNKRPMDNIDVHMDAAQEDEFALLLDGPGSPLDMFAYPEGRSRWDRWFRPQGEDRTKMLAALDRCFRGTSLLHQRKTGQPAPFLLLKSPTHTARLAMLAEHYPNARFIHLARDPMKLFSSTANMVFAMVTTQSLAMPAEGMDELADELALENLNVLYRHFEEDCAALSGDRLHCLAYEDLARQPLEAVEEIYAFLGLELSGDAEHAIKTDIAARGDYQVQQHSVPPELAETIRTRWKVYGERFGYFKP